MICVIHLEKECLRAGLGNPLLDPLAEFTGKKHCNEDMANLLEPKGPRGCNWPENGWLWAPDTEWFSCCGLGRHVKRKLRQFVLYDTFLMWGEHMQRFACIIHSFLVTPCRFSGYFADVNSQFSLHLCILFLIGGWANIKMGNNLSEITTLVQQAELTDWFTLPHPLSSQSTHSHTLSSMTTAIHSS